MHPPCLIALHASSLSMPCLSLAGCHSHHCNAYNAVKFCESESSQFLLSWYISRRAAHLVHTVPAALSHCCYIAPCYTILPPIAQYCCYIARPCNNGTPSLHIHCIIIECCIAVITSLYSE
jgi:hypothetical protein